MSKIPRIVMLCNVPLQKMELRSLMESVTCSTGFRFWMPDMTSTLTQMKSSLACTPSLMEASCPSRRRGLRSQTPTLARLCSHLCSGVKCCVFTCSARCMNTSSNLQAGTSSSSWTKDTLLRCSLHACSKYSKATLLSDTTTTRLTG